VAGAWAGKTAGGCRIHRVSGRRSCPTPGAGRFARPDHSGPGAAKPHASRGNAPVGRKTRAEPVGPRRSVGERPALSPGRRSPHMGRSARPIFKAGAQRAPLFQGRGAARAPFSRPGRRARPFFKAGTLSAPLFQGQDAARALFQGRDAARHASKAGALRPSCRPGRCTPLLL